MESDAGEGSYSLPEESNAMIFKIDLMALARLWDRWKRRKAELERMRWFKDLQKLNQRADKIEKELIEHSVKKPDGNGWINR